MDIKALIFIFLFVPAAYGSFAQQALTNDTGHALPPVVTSRQDTVSNTTHPKYNLVPKKAILYSAVVPGMGQLYNRQYWKMGVVYAALGTGTGFIIFNLKEYHYWRKTYVGFLNNDTTVINKEPQFDPNRGGGGAPSVKKVQDYYEKNLQTSVLLTGLGYILQMVDAIVSAHLRDFDISPDIGLKVRPVAMPNNSLGIGLVMNFK